MKEFIKCKSCGYIMEKSKLKDKCPACGVPAKMFEPFEQKVSEKRRMILENHIHPVIVHAPQAFAFFLLGISIVGVEIQGGIKADLVATMRIASYCLPFFVIAAILSGLFDGKTRFRKVTTPILVTKILFGSLFFLLSAAIFVIAVLTGFNANYQISILILLSLGSFFCSIVLGKLGASIINSIFPG